MAEGLALYPAIGSHRDFDLLRGEHTMAGRLAIVATGAHTDTVVYHDREDPLGDDMDVRPGGSIDELNDDSWASSAILRAVLGERPE